MSGERDYEIIGPFCEWRVTVAGRRVPHLQAVPQNGGKLLLSLGLAATMIEIDVANAATVLPFIADAMAIGMGYMRHPEGDEDPIPAEGKQFGRMLAITSVRTEPAPPAGPVAGGGQDA